MRSFLRVAAFLLVTGASLGDLGNLSHGLNRAISVLALALFFATFRSDFAGARRPSAGAALGGSLLLGAAVPAASLSPLGIGCFHLLVMAAAILFLERASDDAQVELRSWGLAFSFVLLLAEVNRFFPVAWHIKQVAANRLSAAGGRLAGEARNLGPTAMGLPLLVALAALALVRASMRARRMPPPWIAIPVLALVHLGYLVLLTPYASWITNHRPAWGGLILNSQAVFLVLGAATFAAMEGVTARLRRRRTGLQVVAAAPLASAALDSTVAKTMSLRPATPRRSSRRGIWRRVPRDPRLAAAALLGLATVAIMGRATPLAPERPVRVLLYDGGYTNWKVPAHGNYGENSGGMFGLLPRLLAASGFDVARSTDLERLEGPYPPDCLVLINVQQFLEPADKERILRFVRAGGGLLCLGDHTGVAGIRAPFNDLLAPVGIRFRFDSATFFAGGWDDALELRLHPLNRGVHGDEDYQIWVGASLALEPVAEPVIVAKYGYSDYGDMTDLQRAYLGDRRYNPSELLGDVVLVAERRLGRGKVVVFGDTSTYQNLALSRSSGFVQRSIRYLGTTDGGRLGARGQIVVLLLVAGALGVATRGGRDLRPIAAASAAILIASAAAESLTRGDSEPVPDFRRVAPAASLQAATEPGPGKLAVVDRSHGGRYDLRAWYDQSIGGLILNLIRDGFFPVVSVDFPDRELEKADLLVLIAPARSYSERERRALRAFLDRGGRILACVGQEELDGARSLLAEYGFGVQSIPLAHFRTGETADDLVFLEAWALECPSDARVLVRQWGHPVVASRRVGSGEFVLVGDTQFLSNRNLEGRETYFLGNIRFLSSLDSGAPIRPIEGKFSDPNRERGAIADVPPAPPAPGAGASP